jgi:uncharacterized protein
MRRVTAILEVTVVTALVWAAYKAMKLAEPRGFNCSPGIAMLIAASIMVSLRRRDFESYGIASAQWRSALTLGLAFVVPALLGGAVVALRFPGVLEPPTRRPVDVTLVIEVIQVVVYLAIVFLMIRLGWQRFLDRVPLTVTLLFLAALLIAAPAVAVYRGALLSNAAGRAASLVLLTGFGEELFFRGYVQSRLNGVFGRPWRFLGASLGPGLIISSLLFGLIHVFNPTNPYRGHWELVWSWGAVAANGGLLYGYLRELTGSIWASTVAHALGGEYLGLWRFFLSQR